MAEIKLTKDELRLQQRKLTQLEKYLPTLQLKKVLLQVEINHCKKEIDEKEAALMTEYRRAEENSALFSAHVHLFPADMARIEKVRKSYENIAGIDVPVCEGVDFAELNYSLLDTPPWLESALFLLRRLVTAKVSLNLAEEKREVLENELRVVSIRVNLFEKVLIPRSRENIKKIKVFLGDQELAAVSRTKVAKGKIELHRAAIGGGNES